MAGKVSKAQSEWVQIGDKLRKLLLDKLNNFPSGFNGNIDDLRTLILGTCESLEFDILANAYDRAVKSRVPNESEGDEWKDAHPEEED